VQGESNEDYYAFGKELYAPCDGEVVLLVDGVKDNIPGVLNPIYIPGNTVIIKTAKCYFNQIKVNGVFKSDYSPVKGEKIEAGN
jgi:hypothetical protein